MQRSGVLRNLLAGVLIGVGCILPGVSGGVMAVSFGLYRPMLDAVMGFFRDPKQNLRFLCPLAAGGAAGIALGAMCLSGAMARYESLMLFLFTGFILGGVPDLMREAEQKERFHLRWLWSLALGIVLALPLSFFSGQSSAEAFLSPVQSFMTGVLEGIGTVVPGISTSFVLIRLGWYEAYLQAVSSLNGSLIWIAAGFALSALICMRLIQWLFDRYPGHAYYAVLGFLLVSVALVFPGFTHGWMAGAEAGILLCGILCANRISQLEQKQER